MTAIYGEPMELDDDHGHEPKLRAFRLAHGLRQADIADLAGMSISYISLIERGKRELSPVEKGRLARALGVRIGDIFDLPGDRRAA